MSTAPAVVVAPPVSVLVVDDDEQIVELYRSTLVNSWFEVTTAADLASARRALGGQPFDVAVVDLALPDGSGLDLVDALVLTCPDTAIMLVTGTEDRGIAESARLRGAHIYLVKPVSAAQLLIAIDDLVRSRALRAEREEIVARRRETNSFERLVSVAAARDSETGTHSGRMSCLCGAVATELGLGEAQAAAIRRASLLHDIGKVAIPDALLHKPGPLTPPERRAIQKHPTIGWKLLSGSDDPLLDLAATIALCHQERWDGSGYPHGLVGYEIPLEARIAGVCDVFDALASDRPYRGAVAAADALLYIVEGSGTLFDPVVVEAFERAVAQAGISAAAPRRTELGVVATP